MASAPDRVAPHDATPAFRRACHVSVAVILALLVVAIVLPVSGVDLPHVGPSYLFFRMPDVYVLPILLAMLLIAPLRSRRGAPPRARLSPGWLAVAVAVALGLICWLGHFGVFDGYDLSRDEQMANFDAAIFVHARSSWSIPQDWRPFAAALNQLFILPIGAHEAWVSNYLPGNALLRAAMGAVADASLASPMLVAVGALALWRVARRLWPESPESQIVALVLYAGSAQIVLTGMTAYAMSAHLAVDLVWLALFLRGGAASHAGAMLVGFCATGLHQPVFHPLFVLPFLDMLRRERRWRLLVCYIVAYALIGTFWLIWPHWVARHAIASAAGHDNASYLHRLFDILHVFDARSLWLTTLNLLRFATWQHLLLLPLAASGIVVARQDPIARALAIGLVLPVLVTAVILPLQGHGWGYRYLHGVLGNACLLGGYGRRRFAAGGVDLRRPFAVASVATVAVVMPLYAVLTHHWVEPYAATVRAMAASKADMVVVDDGAVLWGQDLVVNRPDLSNRPIRLLASALAPEDMPALCRHGSIAFFDRDRLRAIAAFFGMQDEPAGKGFSALQAAAHAAGCTIVTPPS